MRAVLTAIMAFMVLTVTAQDRKVTPVDQDDKKPQQPTLHYYDKHGNELKEPVYVLADLDTTKTATAKAVYPAMTSISFGANFFDAILKIAGQKYASFDVWASLSLYNWISPVVEAGVGFASNTPKGGNFTYKGLPSFYAKVGFNYNFLYKSNPDYQAYIGFRAGFSSFKYDVKDITISSGYWDETAGFSLPRQQASAFYGEAVAGLSVKIVDRFSLGWSLRYHFKMKVNNGKESAPWFIPGYGAQSPITATLSAIYTLPLSKGKIIKDEDKKSAGK